MGPIFVGYQNLAGSWGRNFVGNWFVALQCKTIHYFFKRSWVRVTHKIHEHHSSKNNNDCIVFIYRICNVPRRTFKGKVKNSEAIYRWIQGQTIHPAILKRRHHFQWRPAKFNNREGYLSHQTCCNTGSKVTRSHPWDCSVYSSITKTKILRIDLS